MFDHVLNTLSPQFQAFISKLLGEEVLDHIYEALQDPRWREALNLGFSRQAQRKYICWMQMVFAIK